MQQITDIREYKAKLRSKFKKYRTSLTTEEKEKMDLTIFNKLISLKEFKNSSTICTYVSTEIEVDTKKLINFSLKNGKRVSVPKCEKGTRNMDFYLINSIDDLEIATFSVLEPKQDTCRKMTNFEGSFFVIPGLCYDMNGYRLGYGKGYYDRFLSKISKQHFYKAGICYCGSTVTKLAHGKFDVPSDILITEKYVKYTGGQNG